MGFFSYQNKLSDIFSVCSPEWGTLSVDKNVHPRLKAFLSKKKDKIQNQHDQKTQKQVVHYDQTRIQPMRFDTKGFLNDSCIG